MRDELSDRLLKRLGNIGSGRAVSCLDVDFDAGDGAARRDSAYGAKAMTPGAAAPSMVKASASIACAAPAES
jgi:hypothetical protein